MAWRSGVIVPLLIAALGAYWAISGDVNMQSGGILRRGLVLEGAAARALGLAMLASAAFVHFPFFWEADPRLAEHAGPGKVASIAVAITAFVYMIYAMIDGFAYG